MGRRLLASVGVVALVLLAFVLLCATGEARAQGPGEPPATAALQNTETDWTVVEFPEGREVVVDLKPTALLPDAKGTARVTRGGEGAAISLDVTGLGDAAGGYHLYAVGHDGRLVPLGAVPAIGGVGALNAKVNASRFMLVLSPESGLTAVDASTPVALRSAVPEGLAVVPRASGAPPEEAASNTDTVPESMPETAAAEAAGEDDQSEYDVPLLGITSLRRGAETQLKSQPAGDLAGTRTAVYVKPLKGGETQVKVRFNNLRAPESGARYVLWAVGPDKTYTRLGQVDGPDRKQAAKIDVRTMLRDFGLLITAESGVAAQHPSGPVAAMVVR
ncbi:MAG TPA: hypothetical protein VN282_11755 [Pyrinomonadaceae bacterium]|nr:hypothetical protein [Pyrinomonadaceae bacterium]